MAVLGVKNPTLADLAKRLNDDGTVATIVEVLNQTNEILDDMVWIEANGVTSHRTTIRSGLPTPTWRKFYGGVQPTKTTTVPVTDQMGMLEAYSEVDKAMADLGGNAAAYRKTEDDGHLEAMSQTMASTLFYGNDNTLPESFLGLAPRFSSLSADNARCIINAGGSGSDNTSLWLVVWGETTVHGIYPKGSMVGLNRRDLGEVTIENADGSNGRMQGYRTHFRWDCGLTVRDWRQVVRIANIDVSALTKDASAGADLLDLVAIALERVNNLRGGRAAFYGNRTVKEFLRRQQVRHPKVQISTDMVAGKSVMSLDGVPVRLCDAITSAEAAVA